MSYVGELQSPELRLDQNHDIQEVGPSSNCGDDSQADNSMQFPAMGNATFFCSEQKNGMVDFNVSHQFDESKVEDEESEQLKKVLLQLRQQLVIQKNIILRDKQIKIKLVEELKKYKKEIEELRTKYSTKSIVSKVHNVHLKFSHLKKKQKLQLRTGRYAASSFLVGHNRRRNLLQENTNNDDSKMMNDAEAEYKHQQSLLFGSFGSPSQKDDQDRPGYFGTQQFKMMTKQINNRDSRSRSNSPLKQRSQSFDLSPEHQVDMVFPTTERAGGQSPNRKSTMKTIKRPKQLDLEEDNCFQMAEESAVKREPQDIEEDSLKSCERLQLRLSNPRQSLPLVTQTNNIYENSNKWDGSQSSFHDGTGDITQLSAPRKLEKQDSRCQSNIDQIEVCYSDMPSIEHRETMIQQYSKEPLNGSTSRGTAINLQEELEEIAPFKGSYHLDKPRIDTQESDTEPEFFKQIKTINELRKQEDNCSNSNNDDLSQSSDSSEQMPMNAFKNQYQQNFDALQIKLNNKQMEVSRKCTFGKQQPPVRTPNFMLNNTKNKTKVEWDNKVRFSDVLKSLNKIQKNLFDLKKRPEAVEMDTVPKSAGRSSLAMMRWQKESPRQRQTLGGWRQHNDDDEIFQSIAISDSHFSSKVVQNRLSTFSTQVKKQRREQEKSKIIDYTERLRTDNKRNGPGHQRKISGMTFQTAKETEQPVEMDVFQSFIRDSNAHIASYNNFVGEITTEKSDGENSTEMWKQPNNACDQSMISDNALPFQLNEKVQPPATATCILNSSNKQDQIEKDLQKLKDNLFSFMNDLEMFKHNLEQICGSYSNNELEQLMENPYFQLISCILDCIYKKVMQIKSIFDFKNKEDNWDARTQMKII